MHKISTELQSAPRVLDKQFSEMRPMLLEINKNIIEPAMQLAKFAQDIQEPLSKFLKELHEQFQPYAALFQRMAEEHKKMQLLEKAGWLPHYTTPFEILNDDYANISDNIDSYYKDNWPLIRKQIESRIASFDLDPETRSVIIEALDAHEKGLYRSVCRLIFPEPAPVTVSAL